MRSPKILLYDLETSPYEGKVWGKYEQTVLKFTRYRELLTVAWKWVGSSRVECESRQGERSDKRLTTHLRELMLSADIVIAHNGRKFDNRVARTRMLANGLQPVKQLVTVDTCQVARDYFSFPGNSLDDLAAFLGVGRKMPLHGIDSWPEPLGSPDRLWRRMERYNKHDVFLLSGVYDKLRPWIENHPNVAALINPIDFKGKCPNCASSSVRKNGLRPTRAAVKQRWACNACGHPFATTLATKKEAA